MISVKRFAQSEVALFKATQDFVQSFAEVTDPIIFISGKAKSVQAKIAWTILGSTLFQGISYTDVMKLMGALYNAFPEEKLWTLPVPKEEDILAVADQILQGTSWSLREHLPGIFWSVGSFVRHHQKDGQDLPQWATERTAEEIWRDLGEVYFMGKGKPRPKAAATIYRLISPAPLGLGLTIQNSPKMPPIPLSMGVRRYLSILGPGKYEKFSELTPDEKNKMAQDVFHELSSKTPNVAAHGLQFFLESGTKEFICRDHYKVCSKCPLYEYCKYAIQK